MDGLKAMGVPPEADIGVIRFSLGRGNTQNEIEAVADRLVHIQAPAPLGVRDEATKHGSRELAGAGRLGEITDALDARIILSYRSREGQALRPTS